MSKTTSKNKHSKESKVCFQNFLKQDRKRENYINKIIFMTAKIN